MALHIKRDYPDWMAREHFDENGRWIPDDSDPVDKGYRDLYYEAGPQAATYFIGAVYAIPVAAVAVGLTLFGCWLVSPKATASGA